MTRPLRLEFAGAVWHVTSRGNERKEIFRDDEDRAVFLRLLARMGNRFGWRIHAFVLMGNHYHLLLDTPQPTLSRGMRELNGIFTQRFNLRHERVGHLMQGRFKAILVEREAHLLELTRYVVLNPVRAGIASRPEDWPWSSYRATAGLCEAPRWLEVAWTLQQFATQPAVARDSFRAFVAAGLRNPSSPWKELRGQIYLGSDAFHSAIRTRIEGRHLSDEIPRSQRFPTRPSLDHVVAATAKAFGVARDELVASRGGTARKLVAFLARSVAFERSRGIAAALSISTAHAAKLAVLGERLVEKDPSVRRRALQITVRCRKLAMAKCQT